MKSLYTDFEGKLLHKDYLESLLKDKQILTEYIGNA